MVPWNHGSDWNPSKTVVCVCSIDDLFVGFQEIISEIGLPNVTWVGTTANYATKDPNEIKIILNNSLDKSSNHKFLEFAFGNSLILAPVEQWKKNRKIFAKAFTQNILDRNVTIFSEKSDILLHVLKQKNDEANLFNIFENFAMDSFLETTIGVDFNIQLKKHTKYFEMIHQ
ncbi:unnamed protein product [Brassicogethes aeneus]|uniref:Cytochrome P450 n=1 Tax=Brassicogethes aeneus TaxID=1431903 RepID=A0A9P0BCA6_BRAAE|nr:unnamed protein product [Brassicogethes aeneus]